MASLKQYALWAVILVGGIAGNVWWHVDAARDAEVPLAEAYGAEISSYTEGYDPIEVSEKYYDTLGPEKMLDVLEQDPYCHAKAHNLGRLIYIKNDRDLMTALDMAGDRCTDAAFHGVLMQVLEDIGVDPKHVSGSEFADLATTFCDSPDVQARVPLGSCIHGVGHVLMFLAENDVAEGLKLCDIFPEKVARYYCATGVYMQREKTVGGDDALVSPRFPCEGNDYPAACYRYKLRDVYPRSEWHKAKAVCEAFPEGLERAGCFHGLGFGFYRVVHNKPKLIEELCDSPHALDRRLCTEGVVGAVIQNISDARAEELCPREGILAPWCGEALNVGNSGMNRDMSVYYVRW